jgi:dTDP-glucose 4,6-dehydratase
LKSGKVGETYNIGGDNEIKNIDIVLNICKLIDKIKPRKDNKRYSELIQYVEDRPGHDFRYAINANKIKHKLGWTPSESFQSGIKKTIEWYLNNQEWLESIYDNTYAQNRLGVLRK